MKNSSMKRISTVYMVLILFSAELYSLPFSRTCYTLSEERMDLFLSSEFITTDGTRRRDALSLNVGITGETTVGATGYMLNSGAAGGERESGDIMLELWHYTGRYFSDKLDTGFQLALTVPSGPDPEKDAKWLNLSGGRSELKIGPVFSCRLTDADILNINFNYIFRQGKSESFYGGFKCNPGDADTYKTLFGLNPFSEDSFLSHDRLSNDYTTASVSFMSLRLSGFVLFSELYAAFYDLGNGDEDEHLYLKNKNSGEYYNPSRFRCQVSAGFKYVINGSLAFQFFLAYNPFHGDGDIERIAGGGINAFF